MCYRPSAKIRDKTVRSLSIYLGRLEEVEAKGVPTIFTQQVEHVDLAAVLKALSFNQVRQKRRCPQGSQVGRGV